MSSKKKHPHAFGRQVKILYPLCWLLLVPLLRIRFRVHFYGAQKVNADKRGCILLANHQSNIDPFLLNSPLNRQVQSFVSDSNMRSPIGKTIFWFFGGIAKAKFMQDFQSMRKAVSVVRGGGVVGIFPEGLASWDGDSLEIIDATAKLIKFLRVPVYSAHICGSYFTLPRWGNSGVRGGRVDITYQSLLTPQQIKQLTVQQIYKEIDQAITVRTQKWQQDRHHAYRGKRRAEYVERFLFLCPHCKQVGTLASHGAQISCAACGPLADIDPYYALQPPPTAQSPIVPFADLAAWNAWQQQYWRAHVHQQAKAAGNDHPPSGKVAAPATAAPASPDHGSLLLPEEQATVKIGHRQKPLRPSGLFGVSLTASGAILYRAIDDRARQNTPNSSETAVNDDTAIHPALQIEGCTVQNGELLEYYRSGTLYQMAICNPRRNAYKWMMTLRYLREIIRADE